MKQLPPRGRPATVRSSFRGRASRRRGVLLLVVLSLLVLFTLIGVTFVLVASRARITARADARGEQYGDDPRKQLDDIFAQLVRDTTNVNSSIRGHSLLNDLYGCDGITGTVTVAPTPQAGNQLYDITITATTSPTSPNLTDPSAINPTTNTAPFIYPYPTTTQLQTAGYFNGCVLTMSSGVANKLSTRIVGWMSNSTTSFTARVMPFDGLTPAQMMQIGPSTGDTVVINGRPFNGTGFGFNPSASSTEMTLVDGHDGANTANNNFLALLPNGIFHPRTNNWLDYPSGGAQPGAFYPFGGIGGADEDYDIADPQNMALAYMPLNPTQSSHILPSFYRPDLLNYWQNQSNWTSPTTGDPTLGRRASLRPLGMGALLPLGVSGPDHQNFTGSNPNFNPLTGPWDVDNDGDGIPDSVWIDVGMPVQIAPDGRRFKPLAAILCLDLDGRLNVNAHGNVAQAGANYSTPIAPSGGTTNPTIADYVFSSSGTAPTVYPIVTASGVPIPPGSGYGPAEINLSGIFAGSASNYQTFFNGTSNGNIRYEGRNGEYGLTGTAFPKPGATAFTSIGGAIADDKLDALMRFDLPTLQNLTTTSGYNYYAPSQQTDYGSPIDLWGRASVGIDYAGQPIYSYLPTSGTPVLGNAPPETPNDPYTLNLSRRRARSAAAIGTVPDDNAFSVGELERILRQYDIDASSLPQRLKYLIDPNNSSTLDLARLITTDSYDLPTPSVLPTRDNIGLLTSQNTIGPYANTPPAGLSIVDLLRAKILSVQGSTTPLTTVNALIAQLLPPEVVAGLRFDINRPFGNGADDDGDGIVDEPDEYSKNNEVPAAWSSLISNLPSGFGFDLNNDGVITTSPSTALGDMYARQQYAKFLYVLMLLLTDFDPSGTTAGFVWAQDPSITITQQQQAELTARRIAQWAINVVDFRDADSIMTPFEYDVNPFNADGWSVDGILTSPDQDAGKPDRRLVWGVESPELLLTETLALHDRRVDDTSGDKLRTDPVPNDTDLDQVRVPQGSAFFELYCPHNSNPSIRSPYSADLYVMDSSATPPQPKLNLGALAPTSSDGVQYPVWQIAITASATVSQANDINTRTLAHPDITNFDPIPPTGNPDPNHYSVFDPSSPAPGPLKTLIPSQPFIERYVWFTGNNGQPPSSSISYAGSIYYNASNTKVLLGPGQYAVVGPRATTYVGLAVTGTVGAAQQIIIDTTAANVRYTPANSSPPNSSPTTYPALPIICVSAQPPSGWTSNVGVSVTEPLFSGVPAPYYQMPTVTGPTGDTDTYATALPHPADDSATTPLGYDKANGLPNILQSGTKPNYKTAFLQRLANPVAAYDATLNPYITVDWQPIDLTVFNGQKKQSTTPPTGGGPWDPDDPPFSPPAGPPTTMTIGSRERGNSSVKANLWDSQPQTPTSAQLNSASAAGSLAVFDYNIMQSLGYVNVAMGLPWTGAPTANPTNYGLKNAPTPTTSGTFPWLTWNNRPYANGMELMLVPATSAEQLMRQFTADATTALTTQSIYDNLNPANFQHPYQHLLPFTLTGTGGGLPPTSTSVSTYFYRLLDYVRVPSRFVGTQNYLAPASLSSFVTPELGLIAPLHPPFNTVNSYRDPGLVNVNTIPTDPAGSNNNVAWNAILNGAGSTFPIGATYPTMQQIVASRRGYGVAGSLPFLQNTASPSYFSNPFRSAGGAAFRLPGLALPLTTREVDVTLLRASPSLVNLGPNSLQNSIVTGAMPLFSSFAPAPAYPFPNRNAYFAYQPLTRVASQLTTRSNVYAVWITVGYFEVSPATTPPTSPSNPTPPPVYTVYPDGYQLGQELGSDAGNVTRHRAFYIYDRSIPVGFNPGHDLNYDKGILVKRYIE